MEVVLAQPRGFCAGVRMAVNALDLALERYGAPVYVYHEIVHNRAIVDEFTEKGVVFVDSIEEIPTDSVVLFSAHGVSPQTKTEALNRNLFAIDATCPLVTKVHLEAVSFVRKGYQIVLIGHAGHDEVMGTMGEAPNHMHLVDSEEDIEELDFAEGTPLAYLTQTTLSVDDATVLISALKRKFPHIAGPPREDICYATQNRQDAVRKLSPGCDLVLVVGSQNSSNSQRLTEIARQASIPSYLVDGPQDLEPAWFEGVHRVLVTAGASAPEELVQACIEWLQEHFSASVSTSVIQEENVHFKIPRELRTVEAASQL